MYSLVIWALFTMLLTSRCDGQMYHDYSKLFDDKFGPNSDYKPTIRPMFNHSHVTEVAVTFQVISIVEVEATTQTFIVNGVMGVEWTDELLAWNESEYNVPVMRPGLKRVWRPRISLMNTIGNRHLFEDDFSPLNVFFNGYVYWAPGSLFRASCRMDLYKYPFDEQLCQIHMISQSDGIRELMFLAKSDVVDRTYFVDSGEWSIKSTSVETGCDPGPAKVSYIKVDFRLQRLPGFFIVTIVAPIIIMSFLNILVFLIPVESGEKISYGISVLLALSLYMSSVSEQLPKSSDRLPIVTVYLLVLTIISVCTVAMSIAIVILHGRNEKQQTAAENLKAAFNDFNDFNDFNAVMNRDVKNFSRVHPAMSASPSSQVSNQSMENSNDESSSETIIKTLNITKDVNHDKNVETSHARNRWRRIDCFSFVGFVVIWVSVTIGFLSEMAL